MFMPDSCNNDARWQETGSGITTLADQPDQETIPAQICSDPLIFPMSPDPIPNMRTLITHPIIGLGAHNALFQVLPSRSLLALVQLFVPLYSRRPAVVDSNPVQHCVRADESNEDGLSIDLAQSCLGYASRVDAFDKDAIVQDLDLDDNASIYYEVVDVAIQTEPTLSDSSSDLATEYADVACQADDETLIE
ncbi:hypothetical protein C8Q76DRAFT_791296 [Earliella scabrosa]|nr:hypothetical protein C8Q76DRAFT_791296 [Earliella scabrosa]